MGERLLVVWLVVLFWVGFDEFGFVNVVVCV